MKTLFDFQVRNLLNDLNAVCESLAVLEAVGVRTPLNRLQYARDDFMRKVIVDIAVEPISSLVEAAPFVMPPSPEVVEDPELHSEAEPRIAIGPDSDLDPEIVF